MIRRKFMEKSIMAASAVAAGVLTPCSRPKTKLRCFRKNHFGSFINADRRTTPASAGLHSNVINAEMGDYSVLTDLMARKHLGRKTILWMLDGLITAPSETAAISPANTAWQMHPFNGLPASNLFFHRTPWP